MHYLRRLSILMTIATAIWPFCTCSWSSPALPEVRVKRLQFKDDGTGLRENTRENAPKRLQNKSKPLANVYSKRMGPEGAPVIVLVHGLDSSSSTWSDIARELSRTYQVILYDQRGHGSTDKEGTDYSSYTMAEDLARLLDGYSISSAHLIGHSMGGRTVLRFSELFPDRVKSVVVEDMDIILKANRSANQIEKNRILASHIEQRIQGRKFKSKVELQAFLEPYFGYNAEYLAKSKSTLGLDGYYHLAIHPEVSLMYRYQPYTEVMGDSLRRFTAPLLFIRADQTVDWSAMSDEGTRQIQAIRPDANVVTIKGSRHSVHKTHPVEFLTQISDFLANSSLERQ